MRLKHPIVHSALHHLALNNKMSIPLKDSEKDLLLRSLTYAKVMLQDKAEPTLTNVNPLLEERLFHQHNLLEYTVLYWVSHLQQSPLAMKPGESNPTPELRKTLPDTVLLPILEQSCWDSRFPTPQAIDLHTIAATVRRALFSEDHPAVLQTYLAIATDYLLLGEREEAAAYFYRSSRICRTVLGENHPLTVETALCYIRMTDSMTTTTTRTEIMTHCEETLTLLISVYERQHGGTSDIVIQARKMLAELYSSINEHDKAKEIYGLIQASTIQHYGRHSQEAHDMQSHLNVVLGKGKEDRTIHGYRETLFQGADEGEQEEMVIRNAQSVDEYLHRAEAYIYQKVYTMAEQCFVELWKEISSKCRTSHIVDMHEKNIEVAIAYSRFLKSQRRTSEACSILSAAWQQYEHHQFSYSEQIVNQLIKVAKEMKTVGMSATALSIFKYVSAFYKDVGRGDTEISREIEKEASSTSADVIRQSLSGPSSTTTQTTTTVPASILQDGFMSVIESSKTVDSNTVSMSQKLSSQYMEKKEHQAATKVIQSMLQRTWPSFFSVSTKDITMTSTFTDESINLVERLAECYIQTKNTEKALDVYQRFFQAVLSTPNVDHNILERAKTGLLNFYDKHRYADNAIATLQDIFVHHRTTYGDNHPRTIHILYDLARRCRAHPRTHPYWVEYYEQIITILNKDSATCHKDAIDAIILVTDTYWEDRRYAEAVPLYRVLWNTFIKETKQHKIFGNTDFVERLYGNFYHCLEKTTASYESLFQVSKQYRETCVSTFGANSSIAMNASLSLAQVAQQSTDHATTAIYLYEALQKMKYTTSTTTSNEISQAISSLYSHQLQSSSNLSSETLSHAISTALTRLEETASKNGYSHPETLSQMKELSLLYYKQNKTESAVKLLTTAVSDIVSQETSSQKLIEAAASIASTFNAIQQTSTGNNLVQELHRQICAKDNQGAAKWSFDLTKVDRSALSFLASMQYNLRSDLSITFAEIMADITMEYLYFEKFLKTLRNNDSLANILHAAAPLRWFLTRNKKHEMIPVVEDQAVALFTKRDTKSLDILSKDAPRLFIVGILDHLGNGRNRNFNRSVIASSNETIQKLAKSKKFTEMYDIANLSFLYATRHHMYDGPNSISMGFRLASLLAGRESGKCPDTNLRKKMLDLSNRIVHKILDTCENLNINFAQVQLYELSQLSVLLAEQQDWSTLEVIACT